MLNARLGPGLLLIVTRDEKEDDSMAKKVGEEWRQDSPQGLLTEARGFRDVGQCALDNYHTSFAFPIYYLFLHAIELALKAYLRQVEAVPMDKLRLEYGHNISKLIRKATDENLRAYCSLNDPQIKALNALSDIYSKKEFEYFRLGPYNLPDIQLVAAATDVLVENIRLMELRVAEDPTNKG